MTETSPSATRPLLKGRGARERLAIVCHTGGGRRRAAGDGGLVAFGVAARAPVGEGQNGDGGDEHRDTGPVVEAQRADLVRLVDAQVLGEEPPKV